MFIPYQKCPICEGLGRVSSGLLENVCPTCNGARIILMHYEAPREQGEAEAVSTPEGTTPLPPEAAIEAVRNGCKVVYYVRSIDGGKGFGERGWGKLSLAEVERGWSSLDGEEYFLVHTLNMDEVEDGTELLLPDATEAFLRGYLLDIPGILIEPLMRKGTVAVLEYLRSLYGRFRRDNMIPKIKKL